MQGVVKTLPHLCQVGVECRFIMTACDCLTKVAAAFRALRNTRVGSDDTREAHLSLMERFLHLQFGQFEVALPQFLCLLGTPALSLRGQSCDFRDQFHAPLLDLSDEVRPLLANLLKGQLCECDL